MGKVTGFLEIDRQVHKYQPASDRIRHFREFTLPMADSVVVEQATTGWDMAAIRRCLPLPVVHGPCR